MNFLDFSKCQHHLRIAINPTCELDRKFMFGCKLIIYKNYKPDPTTFFTVGRIESALRVYFALKMSFIPLTVINSGTPSVSTGFSNFGCSFSSSRLCCYKTKSKNSTYAIFLYDTLRGYATYILAPARKLISAKEGTPLKSNLKPIRRILLRQTISRTVGRFTY